MPEMNKSKSNKITYAGNTNKIVVSSRTNPKKTKTIPTNNSIIKNDSKNVKTKKEKKEKVEAIDVPISYYFIKERIIEFANNKYFPDSIMSFFALLSVAIAFPFYPIILLVPLLVITFLLSRLHPLAGLMALLFITFPIFMYQAPLLAWFYAFFLTIALIFGFKHYRAIIFAYTLVVLPFSFIGNFVEIPLFIFGILYIGLKRALIGTTIAMIAIPVIAGLTGITPFAPIVYNIASFRSVSGASTAFQLMAPSLQTSSLSMFIPNLISSVVKFLDASVYITEGIYLAVLAFSNQIMYIIIQLVIWLVVVFSVSSYVVKHRSPYKATESTLYALAILVTYSALSFILNLNLSIQVISGFIIAPLFLFFLEFNDIDAVRVLDVMKKDFLSTFGEAFEDLSFGTKESLDDIGNYEETKKELMEAILNPIEHKGISKAYNIKPTKGILLFGPPGTGKTLMMRAISKEIRARFIYVKSSTIISSKSGDSSKALSKIFSEARSHTPTVLFFDEIDGISAKRSESTGEASRELLSSLLAELDGFQKIDGVVVVGATNTPNLIDRAILRPGRFDRVIYVPLPNLQGRVEIFKKYAKKYPSTTKLDYQKLSSMTSRFSGADIATIFSETASEVATNAIKTHTPLKIQTSDLLNTISLVKPSTTLSQLEEYEQFKVDFERRLNHETEEKKKDVLLNDVVNLKEAKKILDESIKIPLQHPNLVKEYDLKNITGVLLFGPPGCGKTMLIKAMENHYDEIKFFRILGSDLIKEGYEESLKTIKESFYRAKENAPSVVFIDEIDSLLPNRDQSTEESIKITSEFLREFEELKSTNGVVVIGATNRPEKIDPAVLRPGRIEKLIYIKPPGHEARAELFEKLIPKRLFAENLDFNKLSSASNGFTPAEIVELCREAKLIALERNIEQNDSDEPSLEETKISMSLLLKLISKVKPQANKTVLSRYEIFSSEHNVSE